MDVRDFGGRNIRHNNRNSRPHRMLFIDTESNIDNQGIIQHHTLKLGVTNYIERKLDGSITTSTWKEWRDSEELLDYISSLCYQKSTLYIFAHNAFFDMQCIGFFAYMTKYKWSLDFIYDKGLTYILSLSRDKQSITILSTTNFYDCSLRELGEHLGLLKKGNVFDKETDEQMLEYCKRDVEIIVEAMKEYFGFIDKHDMGNFGYSKASQAFNCFRHRFMNTNITIHNDDQVIALERACYMGGRTEAFEIGEIKGGPFTHLDINSMYPYVMQKYNYPTRLIDYGKDLTPQMVYELTESCLVMVECLLDTNEPAYAYKYKDKICFPTGLLNAFLTTPSYRYAYEHDHVIAVKQCAMYECGPIFKDYIDYFYPLKSKYKKEGNGIYTVLVKKYLNSLYGKFGQANDIEAVEQVLDDDSYYRCECYDETTNEHWTETTILHTKRHTTGKENAKSSLVAIPAHVTDYARMLIWDIIKGIGYGKVLYTDTDSIKIRTSDYSLVKYPIDNYELGALSNEGETEILKIWGCKDYETEHVVKMKGVPSRAIKNEDGSFTYTSFLGQSTHLRLQVDDHYLTKEITKRNRRIYDKGVVNENGIVMPYKLSDW